MKKIKLISSLAALLLAGSALAQNPTSYFMEGSTFRSQLNPALAPTRGYVNIPLLSGIQLGFTGNVSLDKFLFPKNGKLVTIFDNAVSAQEALGGLKNTNSLSMQTRINILGFGAYTKNRRNFWSFDISARVNVDASLPYSLFEFLKLGRNANISGISAEADAYIEAGFNYSFAVGAEKKVYIGVRPKILLGVARAKLNYDKFDVMMNEDRWSVAANGVLDITGAELEIENGGEEYFQPGDLKMKPKKPAGLGFAIDLGATYQILPNLQASFAVNDLGFIKWKKKFNLTAESDKTLNFDGIEIDGNGQTTRQPDFDINVLEFKELDPKDTSKALNATINAGLDYELFHHKLGFGLLYTANIREFETLHNLTASVNYHPKRWVTLSGSYSFLNNRGNAFGLGLNLNPGAINFFMATDMILTKKSKQWVPIKQSFMNLTFGMGVPIGKIGHRVKEYIPLDQIHETVKTVKELSAKDKAKVEKHKADMAKRIEKQAEKDAERMTKEAERMKKHAEKDSELMKKQAEKDAERMTKEAEQMRKNAKKDAELLKKNAKKGTK